MTTEDDFNAALDACPDDWQTRLVFADWLDERGDPRAEGYRALGVLRRNPAGYYGRSFLGNGEHKDIYDWGNSPDKELASEFEQFRACCLPRPWFELLSSVRRTKDPMKTVRDCWERFPTRREAEDAAALAFARLPEPRRKELLTPAGAT